MGMTFKAMPNEDFLYVEVAGEFTLDEATRIFGTVIDLVEANNTEKVLFDGREISGEPTAIERYYYAAFASDSVVLLALHGWLLAPPRFAYVLKQPTLDPLRLGQIIAKKRGMNVKAFEKVDDAMRWLRIDSEELRLYAD